MLLCQTHDLGDLRFRYFEIVHATDAFAFRVYLQHDLRGSRPFHSEYGLQDIDDKFHWRVVVIDKDDTIQRRLLDFRPGFLDREDLPPEFARPEVAKILMGYYQSLS